MSTWWRRNRWALLALPFLIALTVAVGSYRILTIWNPWNPTDPLPAAVGESVTLVDDLEDAGDGYSVEVSLTAGPAHQVTTTQDTYGEQVELPEIPGTVVWQVDLHVDADPSQILGGCRLRLIAEDGRETFYSPARPGPSLPLDACVPPEAPGPQADIGITFEEEEPPPPRPQTYTRPILFRTADDFVPARLDVMWATPTYAALELTTEQGEG